MTGDMLNKKIIFCVLLFLISPRMIFAWDSFAWENHRHITDDAINTLGQSEYPDLFQYKSKWDFWSFSYDGLVEGSADESSHYNPDTGENEWDGPRNLWIKRGADNYKNSKFTRAYDYFGFNIHLIQDSFSPPHISSCTHGVWYYKIFDGIESYANSLSPASYAERIFTETPWRGYDAEGYEWKYWLNDDDDEMPFDGGGYDDKNVPDGPTTPFDITKTWGTYVGGDRLTGNMRPGNDLGEDWYNGGIQGSEIAYRQLYLAFLDTRAELKKFSEELPPLIRNLKIEPSVEGVPIIDPIAGSKITFEMLENRSML